MKFKYEVDPNKLNLAPEAKLELQKGGQKEIFEKFLSNILSVTFKEGLPGKIARLFQRILIKIDDSEDGYIDLNPSESEFLKSIFCTDNFTLSSPFQIRLFSEVEKNVMGMFQKEDKNVAEVTQ